MRAEDKARVGEIEERVAELAGHLNALHGELAGLVGELHRPGRLRGPVPRPDGWAGGWAVRARAAGAVAAVAERVEELPVTVGALQRGELSVDQAAAIARHAPAYADAEARGFAASMTVAQLSRVCRAYPHFETPSEKPETQWRPEKESMTMGFDEDGTWRLAARLDADRGAVVDGALRHHHDRLIAAHLGDGPFPTVRDALVRMAEHSLTGDHDSDVALPAALVVLHVDETTGTARLHQGPVLDAQLAGLVGCDAAVQVQHDDGRRAIGVGRTSRSVPVALRRHVEHRDGGCRVPGCGRRFVQVHHVQHWSHGGRSDPENLIALCAAHHRAHHLGRLGIAGCRCARFPTGSPSPTSGAVPCRRWCRPSRPTEHGRPPPDAATYRHPDGGRLHARDVVFQSADREQRRLGYHWKDGELVRTRAGPGREDHRHGPAVA